MSSVALTGGIFTSEAGQRLITILELLTQRGFRALYDKCNKNVNSDYYQWGLRRVHLWSDDIIQEDCDHVRSKCADLEETLAACFVNYISDRYRGHRPSVSCPATRVFARRFLESIAQHDAMISGAYWQTADVVMRRVACMDAARQAFYTLVTSDNVRVELISEAGTASRVSKVTKPLAQVKRTEVVARGRAAAEEADDDDVRPEDSISQISYAREGGRRQAPPPTHRPRDGSTVSRHSVGRSAPAPSAASSAASRARPVAPPPPSPPSRRRRDEEEEEEDYEDGGGGGGGGDGEEELQGADPRGDGDADEEMPTEQAARRTDPRARTTATALPKRRAQERMPPRVDDDADDVSVVEHPAASVAGSYLATGPPSPVPKAESVVSTSRHHDRHEFTQEGETSKRKYRQSAESVAVTARDAKTSVGLPRATSPRTQR